MKIFLPLLLMTTVSAFSASTAAPLGSQVFAWEDLIVKPTPVGERRDVADQPTATFDRFESHISTLNAGHVSHPPHQHAQEEFIILKTGRVAVHINGREQEIGPGSMFFFASNDFHALRNVGDEPATYLVFNVQTAATKSAPAQPAAQSATTEKLRSQVFDWEKLAVKPTPKGARRDVCDSPTVTCTNFESHITTLNPGEVPHAPHHHPDEELIVVKEGRLAATIKGVTREAGPGSIFFFASNDEHGLRNVGGTVATYYVIRVVTPAGSGLAAK